MKQTILEHHPLSPREIARIADKPIRVVQYKHLHAYKDINDLFGNLDCVLILYNTKQHYGHWIGLINHSHKIYFFDPYSMFPDDQLFFTNIKFRKENDMQYPYLVYLLYHSKKAIDYNDYQFQTFSPNISTCGYWVGYRFRHSKLSTNQFKKLFKGIPKDKLDNTIILLCNKYLQ